MNILASIVSKILGKKPQPAAPDVAPAAVETAVSAPAIVASAQVSPEATPAPVAIDPVDVEAVLADLASKHSEKLDWKKSIVDLMKLVGMDSSLAERKELAQELGYEDDMSDSAKMNIWLHKQVLQKLAENGGKVPSELLS